ncbi:MAG: NAD-dependent epimerase/dehydratase family protein [Bacteroidota bacterium]
MPTYLVTGAMGCIGSWVMHHLVTRGAQVVSFDLGDDRRRLDLLMSHEAQQAIAFEQGDLRDGDRINALVEKHKVDRIIHLAALQVPFCKADPVMGAAVNVVGTVNVFEAARKFNIPHIAYASSVAVFGPPSSYPNGLISDAALTDPHTLYGVYKVANEGTARVYWQDHQISSTALRPYTVYGVGRDQGMTSEPTKAMLAAVKGEAYEIGFSGTMQFQLASDIARYFIQAADRAGDGALTLNIGTEAYSVAAVVDHIKAVKPGADIRFKQNDLPFPEGFTGEALKAYLPDFQETSLEAGIAQTIAHFERSVAAGLL